MTLFFSFGLNYKIDYIYNRTNALTKAIFLLHSVLASAPSYITNNLDSSPIFQFTSSTNADDFYFDYSKQEDILAFLEYLKTYDDFTFKVSPSSGNKLFSQFIVDVENAIRSMQEIKMTHEQRLLYEINSYIPKFSDRGDVIENMSLYNEFRRHKRNYVDAIGVFHKHFVESLDNDSSARDLSVNVKYIRDLFVKIQTRYSTLAYLNKGYRYNYLERVTALDDLILDFEVNSILE